MDGNQGVHGGDENVNDITSNDGVGEGDSSKELVGGGVGNGVGGGVGVGKENDSHSDFVFVSEMSIKDGCLENTIVNAVITEQAREDVLHQEGDVESADVGNEYVDGGLAKESESLVSPPPEDVAQPQAC
ncbi:hypothetical protein K7X08_011482 [Anisodus acutangulus]|uniref:Uncharacterized protein n=1 Tax=Anisodus acutangulus TaxID=402998 RepID=A0A9Q1RLX0_9SOLA|nr:hypothetical protein K7X08_011482 [Anisodus acutangulus]